MARIFLAFVGAAYIGLAAWCSIMPEKSASAVGFVLQPGSGQSEFLTVYGGLELALGLAFLWPLYRPAETALPLILCLLVHGCLVAFRTAGFVMYSNIQSATYGLAMSEWIVFIGTIFVCRLKK